MTKFINRLDYNTIAYNQLKGKNEGIVFLSGFNSDMQGKKALYIEKWAKENNHSFLRFDYSGHGQSSGSIDKTCFSDWYQDAEYLINKLTKDKQILIGSSMGAWVMLMLLKRIPQKISAIIGLAPAPDFPKILIWDKMTGDEKRKLIKTKKTCIKYEDGSKNDFSYKLIKDSFKNLTLSKSIPFNGPVYLYHGMADDAVPYDLSIRIIKNFRGTKDIKLLLDKDAGHRLSETDQLKNITNIIEEIKTKL
jgi:pimeloyl-ACP methyl ester carboxylesterase